MSKEVMAECLEDATKLIDERGWEGFTEDDGDLAVSISLHRQMIAIIAVALYQERMRETNQVGFRLDKASMEAIRSMGHDDGVPGGHP